ncbi:MAG: peptidylprolyl isomerase [Defluviitaleaceae bacterium]|nr:peptidylprolyl isomerase [Defluviitaleaceae bacterium]
MGEFPIATITMEDGGVIRVELYPEIAPNTVNNFIYLANSGFYNGLIFHRVISGFMIQGGCPEGSGMGSPGYFIRGEFASNGIANDLLHERGVISMARRAMPLDSAGSQFFIMHGDSPLLDGDYAGFGRVIEGMDVVDRIAGTQTAAQDRPVADQRIREITVETFGVQYPEPERLSM